MEGIPGGHSSARGDMREPEGEPRRREKPDGEKTRRGPLKSLRSGNCTAAREKRQRRGRKRQPAGKTDMFVFTVFNLGSRYGCFAFPALSLMPRHCCLVFSACLSLLGPRYFCLLRLVCLAFVSCY